MNAHRDPDHLIHAFLQEGRTELTDQVYDAVRADIDHQRQRAVFGPWRFPRMNRFVAIGLGTAAVVVVVVAGAQLLGPPTPNGVGGAPPAQPTATVEAPATPSPTPVPSPIASPATRPILPQSFTSQMHGISVLYPAGWIARGATEPWTDRPGEPEFVHPGFDVLYDPVLADHLFLSITYQWNGDPSTEEWGAAQLARDGCSATEPIVVHSATGLIGANDCDTVAVPAGFGGWVIRLHTSDDDPLAVASYDRAWFEEFLSTVLLQPGNLVRGTPSPAP